MMTGALYVTPTLTPILYDNFEYQQFNFNTYQSEFIKLCAKEVEHWMVNSLAKSLTIDGMTQKRYYNKKLGPTIACRRSCSFYVHFINLRPFFDHQNERHGLVGCRFLPIFSYTNGQCQQRGRMEIRRLTQFAAIFNALEALWSFARFLKQQNPMCVQTIKCVFFIAFQS